MSEHKYVISDEDLEQILYSLFYVRINECIRPICYENSNKLEDDLRLQQKERKAEKERMEALGFTSWGIRDE